MVPTTYAISQELPLQDVQSDFGGKAAVPLTQMLCLTPGWVLSLSDAGEQGPGSGGCVATPWAVLEAETWEMLGLLFACIAE